MSNQGSKARWLILPLSTLAFNLYADALTDARSQLSIWKQLQQAQSNLANNQTALESAKARYDSDYKLYQNAANSISTQQANYDNFWGQYKKSYEYIGGNKNCDDILKMSPAAAAAAVAATTKPTEVASPITAPAVNPTPAPVVTSPEGSTGTEDRGENAPEEETTVEPVVPATTPVVTPAATTPKPVEVSPQDQQVYSNCQNLKTNLSILAGSDWNKGNTEAVKDGSLGLLSQVIDNWKNLSASDSNTISQATQAVDADNQRISLLQDKLPGGSYDTGAVQNAINLLQQQIQALGGVVEEDTPSSPAVPVTTTIVAARANYLSKISQCTKSKSVLTNAKAALARISLAYQNAKKAKKAAQAANLLEQKTNQQQKVSQYNSDMAQKCNAGQINQAKLAYNQLLGQALPAFANICAKKFPGNTGNRTKNAANKTKYNNCYNQYKTTYQKY